MLKTPYKRSCNTKFVKKYGIDKVLTPVVEDINKLYEGYRMKLLQNEILILMCFSDILGRGWSI